MGNVIKAKCRNCLFESKFIFGGNRSNFQEYCPVPAIKTDSNEFVNINYIENKNNPLYIFYSDDSLKGENENKGKFVCFDLKLNVVNNYCPKCENFSLDFFPFMHSD